MFSRLYKPLKPITRRYSYLPQYKTLGMSSTLGQVTKVLYTDYEYKLVYPLVGWIGFLYYYLWEDFKPQSEKDKELKRMEYLKSLEFSQK